MAFHEECAKTEWAAHRSLCRAIVKTMASAKDVNKTSKKRSKVKIAFKINQDEKTQSQIIKCLSVDKLL